jgi:hypothetical protein
MIVRTEPVIVEVFTEPTVPPCKFCNGCGADVRIF